MALPKPSRRVIATKTRKKLWIYSAPFAGKSTLADHFPTPIVLNTDGNVDSYTANVIEVKAEYSNGLLLRQPWEVFVSTVEELARGGHGYETVVVDLVEDVFEHCRVWSCRQLGIEHESDNNFKAWDYVSIHFLSAMKKLTTLPVNVVLLSHCEQREVNRRNGEKFTFVRPLLRDKVANKIAGMVDIVAYLTAEDDGRYLNFKTGDGMFGGGRLELKAPRIESSYEAIVSVYNEQRPLVVEDKAPEGVSPSTTAVAVQSSPSVSRQGSTPRPAKRVAESKKPLDEKSYEGLASEPKPVQGQYESTTPKGILDNLLSSPESDDIPF